MPVQVTVLNFVRAESERMFAGFTAGLPVNTWHHIRQRTPLDEQSVIRMNRDTLYSAAIVDLRGGATVTIPEHGDRYMSLMVVTRDHHIPVILHGPGAHRLDPADLVADHVAVVVRTLVDPSDPADLDAVHALQDALVIEAASAEPFVVPDYDVESLTEVRNALLVLAKGMGGAEGAFGRKEEVDPVKHLLGTAYGWGGLPEYEAEYVTVEPGLPVGEYRIRVGGDVPVDAFWSISVYDGAGFFAPNDLGVNTINSVTARRDPDGGVTVHLGGCGDGRPNCIPLPEGWNYVVRMYRPRKEILDGSWTFPTFEPVTG